MCVCVCVCVCVIESDQGKSDPLHLQRVGRTGSTKRKRASMLVLNFKNVFRNETMESARYLPRFFLINKLYCITELHTYCDNFMAIYSRS